MIVVPVEAPADINATLGVVAYFAQKLDEDVEFVLVVAPDVLSTTDTNDLIDFVDAAAQTGHIRPSVRLILTDSPTTAIVDACRGQMTLMKTHATPYVSDTFVGSHAAALLAVTTAPVILVGPNVDGTSAPVVEDIAIALGGEIEEIELFHHARNLATAIGGKTRHVHVMLPNDEHVLVGDAGDSRFWYPGSAHATLSVDAIETGELDLGRRLAETNRRSMLAMTTHARRGLNRIAEGSVTFDAVHASLLPVLVIGPAAGLQMQADGGDTEDVTGTVATTPAGFHEAIAGRDDQLPVNQFVYRPVTAATGVQDV